MLSREDFENNMFRSLFLVKMVTNIKIYDTMNKNIEICKRGKGDKYGRESKC